MAQHIKKLLESVFPTDAIEYPKKICKRCRLEKSVLEFGIHKGDKRFSSCMSCRHTSKLCKSCLIEKDLSEFRSFKTRHSKNCLECERKVTELTNKTCIKCGVEKDIMEFVLYTAIHRNNICKQCVKERAKEYYTALIQEKDRLGKDPTRKLSVGTNKKEDV